MTRPGPRLIRKLRTAAHPEWTVDGACSEPGTDRSVFFPEKGDDVQAKAQQAKAVCTRCPIDHAVCASYGDQVSPEFGTFGGLTASERKRRRHGERSAAA